MIRRLAYTLGLYALSVVEEVLAPVVPTVDHFEKKVKQENADLKRKIAEEAAPAPTPSVEPVAHEPTAEDILAERVEQLKDEVLRHFDSNGLCISMNQAFLIHEAFEALRHGNDQTFWKAVIEDNVLRLKRDVVRKTVQEATKSHSNRMKRTAANMSNKLYADRERHEDESEEDFQSWRARHLKASIKRRSIWALDLIDEHIVHTGEIEHQLVFVRDPACMRLLAEAERNLEEERWMQFSVDFNRSMNADYMSVTIEDHANWAHRRIERKFRSKGMNRKDRAHQAKLLFNDLVINHEYNSDGRLLEIFFSMDECKSLMTTIETTILKADKAPKKKKVLSEEERAAKKAKKRAAALERRKASAKARLQKAQELYLAYQTAKAKSTFEQAKNDFKDQVTLTWEEFCSELNPKRKPKPAPKTDGKKGKKQKKGKGSKQKQPA